MEDTIEYLKERIAGIKESGQQMNSANWHYQNGCVISGNEAQNIIDFYELHKVERKPPENMPDLTPEWDKIPEGFDWVAIDEDGEECAFNDTPNRLNHCWDFGKYIKTGRKFNTYEIDWTKTLSKRPAKNG